jgi:hypothetical protein
MTDAATAQVPQGEPRAPKPPTDTQMDDTGAFRGYDGHDVERLPLGKWDGWSHANILVELHESLASVEREAVTDKVNDWITAHPDWMAQAADQHEYHRQYARAIAEVRPFTPEQLVKIGLLHEEPEEPPRIGSVVVSVSWLDEGQYHGFVLATNRELNDLELHMDTFLREAADEANAGDFNVLKSSISDDEQA